MIDVKKIEDAAKKYAKEKEKICKELAEKYKSATSIGNWVTVNPDAAFKDGIDWFLKNLWHPASEEPKKFAEVLAEAKLTESINTYLSFKRNDALFKNWAAYSSGANITRWLYVDDLFPKKGGENHD